MLTAGTHVQSISLPHQVIRGPNSLTQLFGFLPKNISRVFIVGGHTALSIALPTIEAVVTNNYLLESAHYGGEVTRTNLAQLKQQASRFDADIIVAIGGGKALDMGKWLADELGLASVTVPTIAATCAATSTVSVIYDEAGHFESLISVNKAPIAVFLDSDIIARAPYQWLAAGLGDTLAKLYEFRAIAENLPQCSFNSSAYMNGKLCYDIIVEFGEQAISDVQQGRTSPALEAVMDAIILYAGFTSIMGVGDHVAAAHALYDGFTTNEKTRLYGHGLLVGFGNLVLQVLEGRSDLELEEAIKIARRCAVPTDLDEIANLTQAELKSICQAAVATPDMNNMPMDVSVEQLMAAVNQVSMFSKSVR
ncbi:iron-containing alcohol dehydrogenase family protein [Reinekea thalattae]|nr:iron-containing alcohol dehydrogenase family protein [Reinekea thalattae]